VTLRALLRTSVVAALCLLLAVPSFSQIGSLSGGTIGGPSKGQVVAIVVVAVAVIAGVGILIYYEVHKNAAVVGCIVSGQDGLSLKTQKGNKTYLLSGNSAALHSGQQVALKGKKTKDSSGKLNLQVQQLAKDYGSCTPAP
jgi:hypothetical protein